MARRMSFSATKAQVYNRTKTVTRRLGADIYKEGDEIIAIEKGMSLKAGEKQVIICRLRITSIRKEPLAMVRVAGECEKEGFPFMTAPEFIRMFQRIHPGANGFTEVQRIEFEYICDDCKGPGPLYRYVDADEQVQNLCNVCEANRRKICQK